MGVILTTPTTGAIAHMVNSQLLLNAVAALELGDFLVNLAKDVV